MKSATLILAVGAALLTFPTTSLGQNPVEVARGASLYGQTCGRCHNLRAATERTDREWVTIMFHMRARANLSRSQSDAILAFLQATNLPEGTPAPIAYDPALATQGRQVPPPQKDKKPQQEKKGKDRKKSQGEKNND